MLLFLLVHRTRFFSLALGPLPGRSAPLRLWLGCASTSSFVWCAERVLWSAVVMGVAYFGGLQRLRADREGNGESQGETR